MNTPEIRFKEFSEEWKFSKIIDLAEIKTGNKDTQNKVVDGLYPFFVRSDNVERINSYSFDGEAILTSGDGVGVGKNVHYINEKFDFHQRVYSIRNFKNELNVKFTYFQFKDRFYDRVKRLSAKNSVDSVRMDMIADMLISYPSLTEQQKIASFFNAVDKKLNQLKKKKELLEQYKKGAIQQIFSQELRFKDKNGEEFPEWKPTLMSEILKEVNEKSTINNQEQILSSTAKGLFRQIDYFKKEVASSDNVGYKILRKNQLVFSPQNLWMGNINVNLKFEIGIVSPSYKIFTFKQIIQPFFAKYLLTRPFMINEYKIASVQGASVVRRNLEMEAFENIKFKLPVLQEQQKIADFLSSIDKKIELVSKQIERTELWKKGLLQKMFV